MSASQEPSNETTYTLCTELVFHFSLYEDRLVAHALRAETDLARVLFTRRMTMLVVQQLLNALPRLTDLGQTPADYWQETLRMNHERAMRARSAEKPSSAVQKQDAAEEDTATVHSVPDTPVFLATELTLKHDNKQLILAFRGLPMPQAMTQPSASVPLFAIPLQADHVHQLIELLIVKARDAHWHLPVELPWLEPLKSPEGSGHRFLLH